MSVCVCVCSIADMYTGVEKMGTYNKMPDDFSRSPPGCHRSAGGGGGGAEAKWGTPPPPALSRHPGRADGGLVPPPSAPRSRGRGISPHTLVVLGPARQKDKRHLSQT